MITFSTFALCFWGAVTLILGIVIGKLVANYKYNRRIHAMMHLPKNVSVLLSQEDVERGALDMQGFLLGHMFVQDANLQWHYNNHLGRSMNDIETEITSSIIPSNFMMTLVNVCHKLGLEIIIREKNGGKERTFSA